MTIFVRPLRRERGACLPMRERNRGPFRRGATDSDALRGGPGTGPTQRPHEGRRPIAPSENPSLRLPLYRQHEPRSPPRPAPMASQVLTRSEPGKTPATPAKISGAHPSTNSTYRIEAPLATRIGADGAAARPVSRERFELASEDERHLAP